MFLLSVKPPDAPPFEHRMGGESLVVGRSADCDLSIADRFLSRHHARLAIADGSLSVEDLGSSNGTQVNGSTITGVTRIGSGDVVRLSGTEITVAEVERGSRDLRADLPDLEPTAMTVLRPADLLLEEAPPPTAPVEELNRYARRLKLINRLHRDLGGAVAVAEVLDLALDGACEHLRPEEAAIHLLDEDGENLRLAAAWPRRSADGPPASQTLRRAVIDEGQAVLAIDARSDQRFSGAESIVAAGARSLLAAPLLDAGGCLGMIVLASRIPVRSFDEDDLELLTSIAAAAAARIRNIRLTRDAAERERLENELRLARKIQMSLLPKRIVQPPGYRVYAANTPSRTVSGDYYQIVERGDGAEVALLIADVCGKGMAAALLTATLEAVCAVLLASDERPVEVFRAACRFLHQRTPPDKFATACLALLDATSGAIELVNAGHNPPLIVRCDGSVEELGATGFPLGLVPESDYEAAHPALAPGDLLVLFTDGIVEAEDPGGAQYGLERLTELCRSERGGAPAEIAAALEADLERFTAGAAQGDDRTYVILRREG